MYTFKLKKYIVTLLLKVKNEKKLTLHCFETKKNLKRDAKTSNDQKIWQKEIEKNKNLAKMNLLEIKVQRNMY